MSDPKVYDQQEAARVASVSFDTIKRAVRATDPNTFPPPLKAKRQGTAKNAKVVILAEDLTAWINSWPDA